MCRLIDLESGRVDILAHGRGVNSAAFSPDGKLAATAGGDNTTRLWNVATAELIKQFGGHVNPVVAVSFDPSSTRRFTSEDGQARVWDTDALTLITQFAPHNDVVTGASFSPDADGAWVSFDECRPHGAGLGHDQRQAGRDHARA